MTSRLALLVLALTAAPPLAVAQEPTAAPPPFQPQVNDPMLAPVEPAPRRVTTWQEALALVRERSTDLRTAEANVQRAEGRWRQSLSLLLPNARLSAGVSTDLLHPGLAVGLTGAPIIPQGNQPIPTVPLASATASLSQSLVDVSAWRGLHSAQFAETSARESLKDVQRRLTLGLARSLVATVAAERSAELNRVGLLRALERAALTERSFQLGVGTQLDVVRVQQDVEIARQALISGDEQLRRTREALGLALGLPQEVGVEPTFQLQGLVDEAISECAALESADKRSDVESARAQLHSARDSRQQATAGYLPTLTLNSSLNGYTTSDPAPATLTTWSLAAVLSVPLWEGGLRGGLVRERRGVEQQSAETLESTRRNVEVEVSRAKRNVGVSESLVKTSAASRELAARTDQLTRRAYEVGRGSSLELVQSGAALRQAELSLVLREFELVQARLDAFLTEARCDW
ncbi:Heavy metal RND efflux outer membrane protein, CzcC family [Cystobacter fuscus DSM 2262]|uniref:Heavy metal RND efflux outer membrane protein, CzcC family n=1 Tax=Cystobacter fuscus (strain ATCC 25194 / DSM 2262 / NBRC 100088 / M29) TaxID=1242864 RepID=S9NXS3_CYSF2|nr:TolC family protein [Cystobacter fuscus]EPX57015.1 Heavy metal RND efflux outer membrane protein, CzcC family [Cystobacter fuscus DSM 2262]